MSFTEKKREMIKKYMLDKIRCQDCEYLQKTMENFQISVTTVKRYLRECLEEGVIEADQEQETGYRLVVQEKQWELDNAKPLTEDKFYFEEVKPLLEGISGNAARIWNYAFTEIMNNAIEHSKGDKIYCTLRKDYLYTEISITDNGIGVFENIKEYAKKQWNMTMDEEQAILELHKGKLTTSPESHSGEGIFFVSKILASFALWSRDKVFSYGVDEKNHFVKSHLFAYYAKLRRIGTMAVMKLENDTGRTARKVFDQYAPIEEGFVKTQLVLNELCPFGEPVARSQARRILYRLEEFKEVIFDFRGIEFMGQGFADEVFRVFHNKHPEVVLTVVNANETVLGMVKHVQR